MSKLNSLLEKYKQAPVDGAATVDGAEQAFMDKHTDNINVTSAPGANTVVPKTKVINRKATNKGYDTGDDAEVYESFEIDDIIEEIVESYYENATDEEIEELESMLDSEEGQDEFLNTIFEELELEFMTEDDEDDDNIIQIDLNDLTEEELNELSQGTLKSYVKSAKADHDAISDHRDDDMPGVPDRIDHVLKKRKEGINRAKSRITTAKS